MTKQPFRFTFFLFMCLVLPLTATAQTEVVISAETIRDFGKTSSENIAFVRDADASNGLAFQFIGGASARPVANPTAWWEVEFWCEAGTYYIWARGKSDGDTGTESFWLQFDDQIGTTDHTADPDFMGRGLGNWRETFHAGIYNWVSQGVPPLTVVMWTTNRTGLHRVRAQPRQNPHYLDQLLISQHQNQQPGNTAWPTEFPRRDPVPAQGKRVTLPDPNLRAKVEQALGKASGATITPAEMATLTKLEARNANISDLTGLEHATNLTMLRLHYNSISDISPLVSNTGLGRGDTVDVRGNPLNAAAFDTHIPTLQGRGVVVYFNSPGAVQTVNIPDPNLRAKVEAALGKASGGPITSAEMANLGGISGDGSNISDLTGLEYGNNMTNLWLWGNNISDISPLAGLANLTRLDLNSNSISDISPLAGLTNLTRLDLNSNSISDISAVAGLTNLTWLELYNNNISDISALAGLTNLTYLALRRNNISDISAVAGLTNLRSLGLDNNISDLSPLVANTGLGSGDIVNVTNNPLSAVSINTHIPTLRGRGVNVAFDAPAPVNIPDPNLRAKVEAALGKASGVTITPAEMATLTQLHAREANISDLTGLEHATNLTELYLDNNSISDISPLAGLINLTVLYLNHNSISDISPLAGLTNLTELYLDNNSISDISPLAGLTKLAWLNLDNNSISDISPLAGLTNLWRLNLDNNSISDISPLVSNTGLDIMNLVYVRGNPLNAAAFDTHIPTLQGRRVWVYFDAVSAVTIPDPNLRAKVETALGKASGATITTDEMATLTRLDASQANISDLTGLEHATNLTYLRLFGNSISDISAVAGLTKLTVLDLSDNSISDISAVAGLTKLEWLHLQSNNISDISAVAGLTKLISLNLVENNILDISALVGLTNLINLWLYGNGISDLSPLVSNTGLGTGDTVYARSNPLSTVSINTHIPTLQGRGVTVNFDAPAVQTVNIPDSNLRAKIEAKLGKAAGATITTADMATLITLDAGKAGISDLTGLEAATNLTELVLHNNEISDISAVVGLTKLIELNLANNPISDISAVAELTKLTRLGLERNPISDISAVAGLTNLTTLWIANTPISDISAVKELTKLTRLVLYNNNILDISVVAGLTNLTELVLSNNKISDISAVVGLTNLTLLNLGDNNISDISALSGLTNPTLLNLDNNSISDLSPLVSNTGLGTGDTVRARSNPLSTVSINTHIPTLQSRGVEVLFDEPGGGTITGITGITGVVSHADGTPIVGAVVRAPGFGSIEVASTTDENGTYRIPYISFAGVVIKVGDEITIEVTDTDDNVIERTHIVTAADISAREATFNVNIPDLNLHAAKEFLLSVPAGNHLIHVPLKVTTVDGVAKTIDTIADLYDALGGANAVNLLATYNSSTQAWLSYFRTSDRGAAADRELTDEMGILASMKTAASIRLQGDALGTAGQSVINLSQGINLVGLPLRDSRITRVSDLLALDGIRGNVPSIIVSDNGENKSVDSAGDPGDIAVTGGQAFRLTAQQPATVTISGEGWTNVSGTAAAPSVGNADLIGIQVTDTTPVLALTGSIVDEGAGVNRTGFRVIVKNRSTPIKDRASTTSSTVTIVTGDERGGYQLTIVDTETGRAAMIGDIFEISAQSPNPFIGVQPLRYTVTAEDVKRSWIQLPALVVYEIPAETQLLANYPNPFNPETWIPYRLAEDAFVTLTIYDGSGRVVRTLNVGHRIAAVYENRSKAIYWDGRNGLGEQVASGVYFYHLSAGDYSQTRRMLILK